MAFIEMDREKLKHNFKYLDELFTKNNIRWGVVSKLLCGNPQFIKELLNLGIKEIHDSRISNLKTIKRIDPTVQTVYIKPPARRSIKSLVRYADVSFNTEYSTIQAISDEAAKQGKNHKIIIMIELGDLREGIMGNDLMEFYSKVFNLPNIEIVGLGTNLNCLHGVMPSHDKLIQLSLYKQLIEEKFKKNIKWVSGGSSVTIPLLMKKLVPAGVNHFRVGETLYLGNNLITGKPIKGMKSDVFRLFAEIIELTEKPKMPIGEMGVNVAGEKTEISESDYGKTSYRAILDIGLLDINPEYIIPVRKNIYFSGASSDMIVMDIGNTRANLKVGDLIEFRLKYMGVLSILNSNYIEKILT
ncbi:MAG: alanine/ornithine racemase family PLP-dependent enzyme [Bacteroidales bacterium]|nr:alanine/ornithine racemase family PLP-dependent enzyme [Bacteroidales bacterium]